MKNLIETLLADKLNENELLQSWFEKEYSPAFTEDEELEEKRSLSTRLSAQIELLQEILKELEVADSAQIKTNKLQKLIDWYYADINKPNPSEIMAKAKELLEAGNHATPAKDVAKNIITAWESLGGDKRYTPSQIQFWLVNEMKPAIDELRKELNLPIPDINS